MTRRGVFVQRVTCMRDDEDQICNALRESLQRGPELVFVTGGLGPTEDDRTLAALSKLSNKRIIVSEIVLKIMGERRNIPPNGFLPHQLKMASTLENAECLPNPLGWAPVTVLKLGKQTIFALPGPPKEVEACFNEHIAMRIQEATQYRSHANRIFITLYESELGSLINEVLESVEGVYIKPLVGERNREEGLGVEIVAFDFTDEGCRQKYDSALTKLKALVTQKGQNVFEQ